MLAEAFAFCRCKKPSQVPYKIAEFMIEGLQSFGVSRFAESGALSFHSHTLTLPVVAGQPAKQPVFVQKVS